MPRDFVISSTEPLSAPVDAPVSATISDDVTDVIDCTLTPATDRLMTSDDDVAMSVPVILITVFPDCGPWNGDTASTPAIRYYYCNTSHTCTDSEHSAIRPVPAVIREHFELHWAWMTAPGHIGEHYCVIAQG